MVDDMNFSESVSRLDDLCPAGYAMALHIQYTTPKLLFQTYNREWMDIYTKDGLVLHDPTVKWGFDNTGLKLWRDLESIDDKGVLEQAKAFGLEYGFTFALDSHSSKSITSFCRDDRDFREDEMAEIVSIVQSLHDATAEADGNSHEASDQLKKLSVRSTHK